MNKFFLLLMLTVTVYACQQQNGKNTEHQLSAQMINNPAEIKFDTLSHDFGVINEGERVTYDFRFTNISKNPMVISEVHASCGCTTPEWTRDIIKQGESSIIKVEYNSEGRPGKFSKGITVVTNTQPNTTLLTIRGEVIPK